jgi:hypothetical protein
MSCEHHSSYPLSHWPPAASRERQPLIEQLVGMHHQAQRAHRQHAPSRGRARMPICMCSTLRLCSQSQKSRWPLAGCWRLVAALGCRGHLGSRRKADGRKNKVYIFATKCECVENDYGLLRGQRPLRPPDSGASDCRDSFVSRCRIGSDRRAFS